MAVVQLTAREVANAGKVLSGPQWHSRFPGSDQVDALIQPFRGNVEDFLDALKDAGASVVVSATFRPAERAYLIYWSWMIKQRKAMPQEVPSMDGVNINWVHSREVDSISAASAMCVKYQTTRLQTPPALHSQHERRLAIDMTIRWDGDLKITNRPGDDIVIKSVPRTGMNSDLHKVGNTYKVIKYNRGGVDRPHWSAEGN